MAWQEFLMAAIIIAAIFWLIRRIAFGQFSLRTPADWPIFILILVLPMASWVTRLPGITQTQVLRLLSGIAIYYAVVNWGHTKDRLAAIITAIIAAGTLLALSSPFSVQWTTSKITIIPTYLYEKFIILVADTVHPNVIAGSLVIILPISLSILLFNWQRANLVQRLFNLIASMIMVSILVLSQSRGSLMALAVIILFLFVIRWQRGWIMISFAGFGALILVSFIGFTPLIDFILGGQNIGGVDGRLEIFSRALFMIQDFPYTGIGMGSFTSVADTFYPFLHASPGSIYHAHNLFLQVGLDLGIPGLIAWLATVIIIISTSWNLFRVGRSLDNTWLASIGAGLLCSQIALITHGLTDAVTWGMVRSAPIVWAIWGFAAAANQVFSQYLYKR